MVTSSSLVWSRLEEVERSLLGVELLRFSREEGLLVPRVTWHLPSPGPGAGCPLQGRLHLLQVRGGCTSAAFSFSATASTESVRRGVEEELEEVEVARVAWWQAALSWSLFLLAGPRGRPAG